MPEAVEEVYNTLKILNPDVGLVLKAFRTLPLTPVRDGFVRFTVRGTPTPVITDDARDYLTRCKDNYASPMLFEFQYNPRTDSFVPDSEKLDAQILSPDLMGDVDKIYRAEFFRTIVEPRRIHAFDFFIKGEDMEKGLENLRQLTRYCLLDTYFIHQLDLGFVPHRGQYDDRLALNLRKPDEGLLLELSGGRLLPEENAERLKEWFKCL